MILGFTVLVLVWARVTFLVVRCSQIEHAMHDGNGWWVGR